MKSDMRSNPSAVGRKEIIKIAAAGTILVAAIALILSYVLHDPRKEFYNDIDLVCVEDLDNLYGFTIQVADLAKHMRKRQPLTCPDCGSDKINRATPCVDCGLLMPTGAHSLPPEYCPYCNFKQPPPTIADHDQIHAPGAHGEEATLVPFSEDDEPDY